MASGTWVLGEGQGLQGEKCWRIWGGKRGYSEGSEGRTGGLGEAKF